MGKKMLNEEDLKEIKKSKKIIRNYCPYCQKPFKFKLDLDKDLKTERGRLTATLIKPHSDCRNFLIFIDPNGNVRGIQSIDGELSNEKSELEKIKEDSSNYMKLFQDQENISDFYYIIKIGDEKRRDKLPNRGIITANEVKYHRLLRTRLIKEWMNIIYTSSQNFGFMFFDDLIIASINLYDIIFFTLGVNIQKFDTDINLHDMASVVKYIKGKAVSLGEKILS